MAEGSKALELRAMKRAALFLVVGLAASTAAPVLAQTRRSRATPTPAPTAGPALLLRVTARKERLDRYLLAAMRRANVNAWLVVTRENSSDPIAFDVGAEHAVARAISLFVDRGENMERVAIVASYDTDAFEKSGLYNRVIPYGKEGAGGVLLDEIAKYGPKTIAVDQSRDLALGDGLTAGNLQWLRDSIGPEFSKRLVSAEALLVSFRSRKTPAEIAKMREAVKKTEAILAEALTPAVVVAGKTTEKDVADFIRRRRREMGLGPSWGDAHDPNVTAGRARGTWGG